MARQRNNTVGLFKLFASYMVIFCHVCFYGTFGVIVDAVARFVVPFFFVVTGFYSYQISLSKIKNRILNIVQLLMFSSVLYTIRNIIKLLVENNIESVYTYFENYLNIRTLIKLFVFNIPVSSRHLWYLYALVYVYIIFYFVTKYKINEKLTYNISFLILALHIILGELLSIWGIVIPAYIFRNFLMLGVPFFGIGLFIKRYETNLKTIPSYIVFGLIIIGSLEAMFSRLLFGPNEIYLGSVLILFAIVIVFIKNSTKEYPKFVVSLTNCSTYIYIFHMLVATIITGVNTAINPYMESSVCFQMIKPLIVCFLSTVLAYSINKVEIYFRKTK